MCCPGLGCVLWDGVGFCAREDLEKRATPMGEDLDKRAAPMSEDLDKRAAPMSEDLDKRAAPENNDPEMVKKRIDYAEYCKKNGIHLSEFKGTAPVTPRASVSNTPS